MSSPTVDTADDAGASPVRLRAWQDRLEAELAGVATDDAAHDVDHVRRVWALCQEIAAADRLACRIDPLVLLAAAYLHDLVNLPKDSPERALASRRSADAAVVKLKAMGFPADKLATVHHAICAHSFSGGVSADTVEAKVLQDADRLEGLGAIGLARVFYVSGRLSRRLFDPDDPLAERRELDDILYAVDHFHTKLFKLPAIMNTEAGRRLATERAEFLRGYLSQLLKELRYDAGASGSAARTCATHASTPRPAVSTTTPARGQGR